MTDGWPGIYIPSRCGFVISLIMMKRLATVKRLNTLPVQFYTPMWKTSTSAADAPVNDLQLIQDMLKLKRTDPEVADAILQKMETHK